MLLKINPKSDRLSDQAMEIAWGIRENKHRRTHHFDLEKFIL